MICKKMIWFMIHSVWWWILVGICLSLFVVDCDFYASTRLDWQLEAYCLQLFCYQTCEHDVLKIYEPILAWPRGLHHCPDVNAEVEIFSIKLNYLNRYSNTQKNHYILSLSKVIRLQYLYFKCVAWMNEFKSLHQNFDLIFLSVTMLLSGFFSALLSYDLTVVGTCYWCTDDVVYVYSLFVDFASIFIGILNPILIATSQ